MINIIAIDLDSYNHDASTGIHTKVMNNNGSQSNMNKHDSYLTSSNNGSITNSNAQPYAIPLYAKITGRGKKPCKSSKSHSQTYFMNWISCVAT